MNKMIEEENKTIEFYCTFCDRTYKLKVTTKNILCQNCGHFLIEKDLVKKSNSKFLGPI